MVSVLISSSVRQKAEILREFLLSLKRLKKDGLAVDYCFVDENDDEDAKELLKEFTDGICGKIIIESRPQDLYIKDGDTHHWKESLIWKVADNKNMILKLAKEKEYDFVFLVDSDIVLKPETLVHLISLNKDIVSEIFWTRWRKNSIELPQVWVSDQYTLFYKRRDEQITEVDANRRIMDFLNMLKVPGIYKVGGLGACTLISKKAILKGVSFDEIYNVSFWGEDRHFCIRAAALGFELFVDTNYPAFHIYRDDDLKRVKK